MRSNLGIVASSRVAGAATPPAVVQTTSQLTISTTVNATWSSTPTDGNLMIVAMAGGGTFTTPTGWTAGPTDTAGGMKVAIFYKVAASETTGLTFEASLNSRLAAWEVSNLSGTHDAFGNGGVAGNGTSMSMSATATTDVGFAIAVASTNVAITDLAWTGDVSARLVHSSLNTADLTYSTSGTKTANVSWTGSAQRGGIVVTFPGGS